MKYLKLTSAEAIRHFILRDKSLVPEQGKEIAHKLKDLDNLKSELSVTIVLPTHHTKPDYLKDVIELKNLVTETENELVDTLGKRKAAPIIENIKEAQATVDYSLSIDSMVIYANEYFASVLRLPVSLPPEILINKYFDLRPLYKTLQQNRRYYILAISRNMIRLVQAFNDRVVDEVNNNDFPFPNRDYFTKDATKLMQDTFEENQYKEYFNDSDKMFQHYYNNNPLPVILAGDIKTISYYEEQMDKESMVIARVYGNYDKAPLHELVKAVQPELEKYREEKQKEYLSQMDTAASAILLSTDLNEIYQAAVNGAADTLYIGEYFTLNGTIDDDNQIEPTERAENVINRGDLLSGLIQQININGGNIVFVEDDKMQQYNGIALVRRF